MCSCSPGPPKQELVVIRYNEGLCYRQKYIFTELAMKLHYSRPAKCQKATWC